MDDEQIKKLLKQNLAISKESLKILKKMHRTQVLGRLFKIIYWAIIIGGIFGAYYYLQPFVSNFIETWQSVGEISSDLPDKIDNLLPR